MSALYRIAFSLLLVVAQTVSASDEPGWSFEAKGGRFESAEAQWADFYGDERFPAYALSVGYKLLRQIEVGVETGYLADSGEGLAAGHGILAGDVKYRLFPIHLHLTARGVFTPNQWLVPYVGVAWSRYSYMVETEGQSDVSGAVNGHQYRGGVQLLLDVLDRPAASNLEDNYGIENTYLFLEAQRTNVSTSGVDLGGTAYLGGLLFEF